jgi:hypothetical protein
MHFVPLAPHPYLCPFVCPFVLADLLVSYFIGYGSAYFGPTCMPSYIVVYIQIASIWERMLLGSVPHAFTLIDTVYIDLTGLLVRTLRTPPAL